MATAAFDIVGTLFSLDAPRQELVAQGAPESTLELWLAQALRDYFALSHSGQYTALKRVLQDALPRALLAIGIEPERSVTEAVLATFEELQPAEGAHQACDTLLDAGFTLVALTNSSEKTTRQLLEQSALAEKFTTVISCDSIGTSKPHPKVYEQIHEHGQAPLWMLAAHGWDIAGAAHANLQTAWISSVENTYLDVFPSPDIKADSLDDAAIQIVSRERGR